MKITRKTMAPSTPQNNTRWRYAPGTAKYEKITRKTKMLSTLSAFSIRYPVRNSRPRSGPNHRNTPALNTSARAIQKTLQPNASRGPMTWAVRWKTPRSRASMASTNSVKPPQSQGVPTDSITGHPPCGTGGLVRAASRVDACRGPCPPSKEKASARRSAEVSSSQRDRAGTPPS